MFGIEVPATVAAAVPSFPKPAALPAVAPAAPPPIAINKFVAWSPTDPAIVGKTVDLSLKPLIP